MIQTKSNNHNGVDYKKIESDQEVEGACAFGDSKYVLKGKPAIETMEGSRKFGGQVQITLYNKPGSVIRHLRVPYAGRYDRIEIFFPKDMFTEMCKKFLEEKPT